MRHKTVTLPSGQTLPALGQGTWYMGRDASARKAEIGALQLGLDLGLSVIDTAELYADGGAEAVTGAAIRGRRDEVFLVSKVLPSNASRAGTIAACEKSLKRLGTEKIDLYLLHWTGHHRLAETIAGFETLRAQGKIGAWGVSNFDVADMEELLKESGGNAVATNQVLYNLTRRGIEFDLIPWSRAHHVPLMAYSPIEQGRLAAHPALSAIATAKGVTPAQIALAFVLDRPGILAIPKATAPAHVRANAAAREIVLTDADRRALDKAFPPPASKKALEVI